MHRWPRLVILFMVGLVVVGMVQRAFHRAVKPLPGTHTVSDIVRSGG